MLTGIVSVRTTSNACVLPELLIVNVKVIGSPESPVVGLADLLTVNVGSTIVTAGAATVGSVEVRYDICTLFARFVPDTFCETLRTTAV